MRIHFHYKNTVVERKRYMSDWWNPFSWFDGGDEENTQTQTTVSTPTFAAAPTVPEADKARATWWDSLQEGQKTGTYGAVMPNYDKIFENAKQRINQYYWGGPSGGGLINKIRAGAARRGVAESPAIDVLTQRMGAEQANQLGNMSSDLDVTKANAVESARTNWLNSLMSLSNQNVQGTWANNTTQTLTAPQTDYMPSLIGAGAGLAGNMMMNQSLEKRNQDWLSKIYGMPNQMPGSLTSGSEGFTSSRGFDWGNAASLALGVGSMFV